MDSACRGHFRLRIQEVPKSLEADKEYRLLILSLLRMPISPRRRRLTSTVYQNAQQNPQQTGRFGEDHHLSVTGLLATNVSDPRLVAAVLSCELACVPTPV